MGLPFKSDGIAHHSFEKGLSYRYRRGDVAATCSTERQKLCVVLTKGIISKVLHTAENVAGTCTKDMLSAVCPWHMSPLHFLPCFVHLLAFSLLHVPLHIPAT